MNIGDHVRLALGRHNPEAKRYRGTVFDIFEWLDFPIAVRWSTGPGPRFAECESCYTPGALIVVSAVERLGELVDPADAGPG